MLKDQYVAGLFDGEGCVRIQRWAKPNSTHIRYQVRCSLGMTHKDVIKRLAKTYGGSLHVNDHSKRNKNHRPQFSWVAGSRVGVDFLKRILPFLIVKREEVKLALKLQQSIDEHDYRSGARYKDVKSRKKELDKREKLFQKITKLKHLSYGVSF